MRRICVSLFFISLSVGCGSIGYAADMPAKAPVYKAPMVAPVYNWTGVYLGGSLGGAWASDDWLFGTGVAPTTPNSSSIIGGGFVGAQWQWSNIVLGVEANFLWDRLKSDGTCPNPAFTCRLEPNRYWTVGPRAGWAMNNWLVYGTGGYAQTHIDTTRSRLRPAQSRTPHPIGTKAGSPAAASNTH